MHVLPNFAALFSFFALIFQTVDDSNRLLSEVQAELERRGQYQAAVGGGDLVAAPEGHI